LCHSADSKILIRRIIGSIKRGERQISRIKKEDYEMTDLLEDVAADGTSFQQPDRSIIFSRDER
jgi:hypothetical protein